MNILRKILMGIKEAFIILEDCAMGADGYRVERYPDGINMVKVPKR